MKQWICLPEKSVKKSTSCMLYPAYHLADDFWKNHNVGVVLNIPKYKSENGCHLSNNFFNYLNVQNDFQINFQSCVTIDVLEVETSQPKYYFSWANVPYCQHFFDKNFTGFIDAYSFKERHPTKVNYYHPSFATYDKIKCSSLILNMNQNELWFNYQTRVEDEVDLYHAKKDPNSFLVNTGCLKVLKIQNAKLVTLNIWSKDLQELELSGENRIYALKTPNLQKLIVDRVGPNCVQWDDESISGENNLLQNLKYLRIKNFDIHFMATNLHMFLANEKKIKDDCIVKIDKIDKSVVLTKNEFFQVAALYGCSEKFAKAFLAFKYTNILVPLKALIEKLQETNFEITFGKLKELFIKLFNKYVEQLYRKFNIDWSNQQNLLNQFNNFVKEDNNLSYTIFFWDFNDHSEIPYTVYDIKDESVKKLVLDFEKYNNI